ncbi:MAG TPA: leucyl aminopeptidase family protein [Pseudobdellovibrionaceae bacterium]|jgi:leucyl aminopeptidase
MRFKSWLESFLINKEPKNKSANTGYVYYLGTSEDPKGKTKFLSLTEEHALSWQLTELKKNEREMVFFVGVKGPVWIVRPRRKLDSVQHQGLLEESDYAFSRDLFGGLLGHFKAHALEQIRIEYIDTDFEPELGSLVGLGMSSYNFRQIHELKPQNWPEVFLLKSSGDFDKSTLHQAQARARSVNIARHLVNLPPNELNPKTFVDFAKKLGLPVSMKIAVWDAARLKKEKMGLLLAVGQGAEFGPYLLHLKYRPAKKTSLKPMAFVGKGVTFDSGGLDIKPSAAMRLMKKDMGGAASVLALASWVADIKYPGPCDFYIALAENAVDAKAFRPSDVFIARNGLSVEIDNTDAEGRLILADALDVAASQTGANEPEAVINVATLTGAIKVGLGAEIAGLFSNDDELADSLNTAGYRAGDLNWRMPLYNKYFSEMSSPFADFKNSGGGFGGAITAALFLQKFVRGKKWAHLDIYSWTDKAQGALSAQGGNGQPVQALIEYLESRI